MMGSSYTESYKDLYHGTTEAYAEEIVSSQEFIPSTKGWCGAGVYFYDVKAKAWWSAARTCGELRKKGEFGVKPAVVIADVSSLNREQILDLRSPDKLQDFATFVNDVLCEFDFDIVEGLSESEVFDYKRAMLLSFYCSENNKQLVIGYFKQKDQTKLEDKKAFADAWELVVGIETIYCVKDTSIIYNIRRR